MTTVNPEPSPTLFLIAAMRDARTWALMVDRYAPRIRSLIHRQLPSVLAHRAMIEDTLQEILMALARSSKGLDFESLGAFEAYLVQLSRSKTADCVRRHGAAKRNVDREARTPADLEIEPARVSSPSRNLRREDAEVGLEAILARLAPEHREILRWIHLERMKPRDVAARLEITQAAVRKRLERALRACRQVAEGETFDDWREPTR